MKLLNGLFFILAFAFAASAQIKVDSNYTILAKGINEKLNQLPYLYANLACLTIKEKSSGKTCMPVSVQLTLIIQSEIFQFGTIAEAQPYMNRMKPKDTIFVEKIKMPEGCFSPPKQIALTIM